MEERTGTRSGPDQSAPRSTDGDLDLANFFSIIWISRVFISACTAITVILGFVYAFLATPVYFSQATITLKNPDKGAGASGFLSQLGGVGGMDELKKVFDLPTLIHEGICKVIADPDCREQLVQRGLRKAIRYSPATISGRYLDLYNRTACS